MPKRGQVIIDDYLKRIVSGELPEGALLPTETALIEQYKVSRTAVREAVQALAHKGFVTIRQGSGSTVAPRRRWNVLDSDFLALTGGSDSLADDVADTREIIAPAVAALAASKATAEQVADLNSIVSDMQATTKADELSALDANLHNAISEAAGNRVLQSLLNSVASLETAMGNDLANHPDLAEQTATWSEYVVDAIASRDSEAARDAMRMHLRKLHRSKKSDPPAE